jgi:hypothetical protein
MKAKSLWRRSVTLFAVLTLTLLAIAIGIEISAKLAGNAWQ